jgi:Fic family protein
MLTATERQTDQLSIIRSRREIVQHAIAMRYIIEMLIVKDLPLDEEMILETYRLLMQYSDHEEGSGSYRSSDEAASHGLRLETDAEYGLRVRDAKRLKPNRPPPERMAKPLFFSKSVRGESVASYMKRLVEDYNSDIKDAEKSCIMDPIDIASKFCHYFVCIHAFGDGNGRLCRLFLNAFLLKYTGAITAIGVDYEE